MQLQANITFNVEPVVTIWEENGATKVRIFRCLDLAHEFIFNNALWENDARCFSENGTALQCPHNPEEGVQVTAG